LAAINPDVKVVPHKGRIDAANAMDLIGGYDIVADGSDNFPTRFLVNDACYFARVPLVSGAILRFDGQIATYNPHGKTDEGEPGPCYRCLFREPPPPGQTATCAEAGVLGALCGMVGSLQATEVLKEILGIGDSLAGYLTIYDGLGSTFRKIRVKRDPECPLCGEHPTITDLSMHGGGAAGGGETGGEP
jgi:adenylyltransferase/sulfurtransferase